MAENTIGNRRRVPADVRRMIEGLRDTGYNTNMAVADIVDNSIAAGASEVRIMLQLLTNGRVVVIFGDDGHGMDEEGVELAIKYGSPERDDKKSLGKFGMGLNTASSSICQRYSVISKLNKDHELFKMTCDLDVVRETREWDMLTDPVSIDEKETFDELCGSTGTLVIWEKCDRLLGNNNREDAGDTRKKADLKKVAKSLEQHLAMIFHRFLDPDDGRAQNVKMFINELPIASWNPFVPTLSEAFILDPILVQNEDETEATITWTAWLLPHKNDCDKAELDLVKHANHKQGFWIYRENRLIQPGTWANIGLVQEPHGALLRVEFDFTHELDDAFKVDVKKSNIIINPDLAEVLKKHITPFRREADNRSRRKQKTQLAGRNVNHQGANVAVTGATGTTTPTVLSADTGQQQAEFQNNRGRIIIKVPVGAAPKTKDVHIRAVDDIYDGQLWKAKLETDKDTGGRLVVLLNKNHDFYTKIYLSASKDAVTGIDLLIWSIVNAEFNNVNEETVRIFEDFRDEISTNLKKLLYDYDGPDLDDLTG